MQTADSDAIPLSGWFSGNAGHIFVTLAHSHDILCRFQRLRAGIERGTRRSGVHDADDLGPAGQDDPDRLHGRRRQSRRLFSGSNAVIGADDADGRFHRSGNARCENADMDFAVSFPLRCNHGLGFATQNLSKVPREARAAWFAGFGITLTVVNAIIVGLCYGVVAAFPPLVAGVLFFLTPVYFVASIWASARHSVVKVAFVIGVIAGPVFAVIAPEFDILYAGIGGGTAAYLIDRFVFRRRIKPVSSESES